VEELLASESEKLGELPDIGPVVAATVVEFLARPEIVALIDGLRAAGFFRAQEVLPPPLPDVTEISGEISGETSERTSGKTSGKTSVKRSGEISGETSGKTTRGFFGGRSFVLTGALQEMTRTEARRAIEARGGKVTGSVSKRTAALVVGADPGSKLKKARELEIPVLEESEFQDRLAAEPE